MSLMYAQMGLSVSRAALGYGSDKIKHDIATMQQDYDNAMSALSAAQQLNTITQNEISVRDAAVRASTAIDIQAMKDRADAEVSAAAAGVRGGSVRSTLRGLARSRLTAKQSLHKRVKAQAQASTQSRRNTELSKVFSKDISVLPTPSTASALLGLGATIIDTYDSHQPDGQKVADTIAGWGR